jgi:hypothetical protein
MGTFSRKGDPSDRAAPASMNGDRHRSIQDPFGAVTAEGWRATPGPPRAHPPDSVADVVRDQERAGPVDRDSDRAAERLAVLVDEVGQHVRRIDFRPRTQGRRNTAGPVTEDSR